MIITRKLCMTKDVGVNGNLFGGNMMAWIDEAAAIYAKHITEEEFLVTKEFSEISFKHPVKVGDIIEFDCVLIKFGNTSVSFWISGNVKNYTVFTTRCVFVAVDHNGNKKQIIPNKLYKDKL